jgi:Ca2+-binding EF-hand superfamily protein
MLTDLAREYFDEADVDRSGKIDYTEFRKFVRGFAPDDNECTEEFI